MAIRDLKEGLMLHNKTLWALGIAASMRSTGFAAAWIFMAIFLKLDLGLPIYVVGIVFTFNAVSSVAFSLLSGALTDYIGRRKTLLIGSSTNLLIFLGLAFLLKSGSPALFIITLFVLSSFGGAFNRSSSSAMVADVTTEANRIQAYSLYRVLINSGWAIGPLIGSLILVHGMYYIFLFVAGASTIQFLILFIFVRESSTTLGNRKTSGTKFSMISFDRYLFVFALSVFFLIMVASQFSVTLPTFSVFANGIPKSQIGYIFAINGIMVVFGQYPMIKLFSGFSDISKIRLGIVLYAIGYFLVAFSPSVYLLMLDMAIITAGENLSSPGISTVISKIAPKDKMGRYMAFNQMMLQSGRAIGPAIGTFLMFLYAYDGVKVWGTIDIFAMMSIAILFVFNRMIKSRRDVDPRITTGTHHVHF